MRASAEAAGQGKADLKAAHPWPRVARRPEAVRPQLETILACPTFRSARAQANFLRHVVEETLAGRGDQIKDYSIGKEVFGRGTSFDPRVNNIVRAEANRLRTRLVKYYTAEGSQSAIHRTT